jgi:O-acetylserine/cysteine efflux transporter
MTRIDLLLVVLTNIVWGSNVIASKFGLVHFPPLLFTSLRFATVLLFLFPLLLQPLHGQGRRLLLIGLTMGIMHYSLVFTGLALSHDISSVAIASQLYVPFSTLMAVLFLGERIAWRRTLGMTIAFLGVAVISFDPAVFSNLLALAFVSTAALMMAISNIFISQMRGRIKPMALQVWVALIAAPGLLLLSLTLETGQWTAMTDASLSQWSSVLYSSVGATIIGHGILAYLLSRYPVSMVTPMMLPTPLIGVIFGVIFWGDQLSAELIIGGSMTLFGVAVIALRSAKKLQQKQ